MVITFSWLTKIICRAKRNFYSHCTRTLGTWKIKFISKREKNQARTFIQVWVFALTEFESPFSGHRYPVWSPNTWWTLSCKDSKKFSFWGINQCTYEIPHCSAWVPGAPLLGSFLQGKAEKPNAVVPLWRGASTCGVHRGALTLKTALALWSQSVMCVFWKIS